MDEHHKPFAVGPALLAKGQSPMPLRPASQAPFLSDWTQFCSEPMPAREVEHFAQSAVSYNVALALGYRGLIAVDRDTDEAAVIDALRSVFKAIYQRGGIPVAKFGSKGLTSFFRWSDPTPFRNRSFVAPSGSPLGTFFEISGHGRSTTLPPSIHPKTGRPYTWRTWRTLLDTTIDELPALTASDVCAIEVALLPFIPPPRQPAPDAAVSRPTVSRTELDERERRRLAAYASAIINAEKAILAAMPPGSGRNRKAFDIACRVGRYVHGGIIDARIVVEPLTAACFANGLVGEDGRARVLATINSGLRRSAGDALEALTDRQPPARRASA